jgi:hypothetical protein
VTGLTAWTGGLVGERDPAQPLLTLYDGAARVELSGATTANWVAKSANLLVDGYGGPEQVGLLLPLHWQSVALLLAGVTAGARVVVGRDPADLAGCEARFTSPTPRGGAGRRASTTCWPCPGTRSAPRAGRCRRWSATTPARSRRTATAGADRARPHPRAGGGRRWRRGTLGGSSRADRVLLPARFGAPATVAAVLGVLRAGRRWCSLPGPARWTSSAGRPTSGRPPRGASRRQRRSLGEGGGVRGRRQGYPGVRPSGVAAPS